MRRDAVRRPLGVTPDAIGYQFLISVFFVTSGIRSDLDALTENPLALALVAGLLTVVLALAPTFRLGDAATTVAPPTLPITATRPMGTQH